MNCECGCGLRGNPNRMRLVTVTYYERCEDEVRTRTGRRFWVLEEHEKPFQRELNGMAALRHLAMQAENMHWWRRVWSAPLVYRSQFFVVRRHKTFWQAHLHAENVMLVYALPEKLSDAFTARRRLSARDAAPKGAA